MSIFVDTSVWSLAFRRDQPLAVPEVDMLMRALESGEWVITTGLVLQEVLQGFGGPKMRDQILQRFSSLPMLSPTREDHVNAAELRNHCRRNDVQIKTVDALLAYLCIANGLAMLTADNDFHHIAKHSSLRIWQA